MGTRHAGALAAAYRKYAWTHLRWVPRPRVPIQRMGAPPGLWTFLSSLGESGFFSSLLECGDQEQDEGGGEADLGPAEAAYVEGGVPPA